MDGHLKAVGRSHICFQISGAFRSGLSKTVKNDNESFQLNGNVLLMSYCVIDLELLEGVPGC